MSMLSPELETAIRHALDDATNRGHEFSGLEHLLRTGDAVIGLRIPLDGTTHG